MFCKWNCWEEAVWSLGGLVWILGLYKHKSDRCEVGKVGKASCSTLISKYAKLHPPAKSCRKDETEEQKYQHQWLQKRSGYVGL